MSIQIFRDAWGIPHLRAGDARELAFAQGRAAATDRAWQIEVERHRAAGTSAAFLGGDSVGWDRFARQARIEDTARRCFRALDADTAAWVESYVDGVEAGLADGARRAPEFAATGLAPGRWRPWTPLAIWLSHHILFAGFPAKLWREEVATRLGTHAIEVFATDGPGTSGSNGWLVGGDRTTTGAALVAGDPHRFIEDPGIYQQIHLACPEYDVVGLAVPGVPGIAHFGHAGSVAWAITNSMADYQDLYRERLRRRGAEVEALGPDGWRPASAHVEIIEVAGGEPVEVEVIETERGPVVIGAPAGRAGSGAAAGRDGSGDGDPGGRPDADPSGEAAWEAISLRCPPRVRADLGFRALPALLRAKTVADVDRALDLWAEPVNVVLAADTDGGLLHRVAGAVPLRHPDNGVRVVRAWEPGHEWRGWQDPMPRADVDGLAVMANHRDLAEPLGVEFAPPYRADRIRHLLDVPTAWTAKDMAAVHTDTHLASAGPLLDLLAALDGLGPEAVRLRDRLLRWDRRMDAGSADAASYAALRSAVVRRLAAHPALAALAGPTGTAGAVRDSEDSRESGGSGESGAPIPYPEIFLPWIALVPRVAYALENLLTTTALPALDQTGPSRADMVRAAVEEVASHGRTSVPWGETHRLAPWQALPGETPEEWPALSGDHDCVLSTSSVPGVTDLSARGPAARYVWDLARRDDSLWVVPFGASGVPGDAHRRDQLPLWLRGDLVPVITDWTLLTEERHDH
ncbi:penicillin acylase family protein [Microtetraspora sp. AC03309]|uniref:penicillin acylase family protein n=1 Tax=Microtetraspora sp. AC03309 TaxID=2779376 RepID=UPI001E2B1BB6|nr:penicillin acylase family protein [Microtetraspora sp. AC03309]MCC5579463.1 penicillin acylase family protein [Microtetraspora sp. AC03309]